MAVANNNDEPRDSSSSKRRKKKRMKTQFSSDRYQSDNKNVISLWKSEERRHVFSTKLLRVLRLGSGTVASGRAVREAADRVLAMTAKGRSRWSRAILINKHKRKFRKCKNHRLKKPEGVAILRLKSPAVQRKARDLGRLIPGCRKQALSVILEEATDYIAALEMQVKAMTALADLFSGSYGLMALSPEP